ncbi:transmembrane protein 135 [Parasteatoda tepidariorum]|uniref:transmembrane protein 135 n=1 Tax=Parasteatoda tepidariorum TaxID=114398 RepID=UPI00077F8B28|nr:transmembrane protein 135 [Parasteatoda tepidariorum]
MAVLSKLRELSLPYNCYEVGHTWTPECYTAALSVGLCCLFEGMKLYAPLYLVTQILQRKFSARAFWNTIQSIYTSSCFLGFNGFAFIFIFCLLRRAMGKFYYLHCSYFPGFMASFLAILIERENRRGPLALYVTNVASETLFRMATARGIVRSYPNGEIFLFSSTMAVFLFIVRRYGFSKDFVSAAFKFVFGKDEAKPRNVSASKQTSIIPNKIPEGISRLSNIEEIVDDAHRSFFQKVFGNSKHASCPHKSGCLQYVLKGTLRPFLIGYLAFLGIRTAAAGKKLLSKPQLWFKLLTETKTLNLGLFLGGFGGTFRVINCLLRWSFNRDHPAFALPAAFLGGMFMKFFPSPTLSLYLMWKLIEVGYMLGIDEGVLPNIKGSMLMLYATSTAFLFYAAVLEPHNLKPAYLKFLTRLTHNKIGEINRHVLDIFGTHASKLYSDFWPELDLRFTSRVFQESVLLWLIH